jgi:hypothetical protein
MWVSTLLQRRKIGPLGAGDSDRQAVTLKNSGGYFFDSFLHGGNRSPGTERSAASHQFSAGCRISGGINLSGGGRLSSCDGLSGANDDLLPNGGGSFPDGDCLSGGGDRKGGDKVNLDCGAGIRISQRREVDCDREDQTNHSPARWRHSTLRNVS